MCAIYLNSPFWFMSSASLKKTNDLSYLSGMATWKQISQIFFFPFFSHSYRYFICSYYCFDFHLLFVYYCTIFPDLFLLSLPCSFSLLLTLYISHFKLLLSLCFVSFTLCIQNFFIYTFTIISFFKLFILCIPIFNILPYTCALFIFPLWLFFLQTASLFIVSQPGKQNLLWRLRTVILINVFFWGAAIWYVKGCWYDGSLFLWCHPSGLTEIGSPWSRPDAHHTRGKTESLRNSTLIQMRTKYLYSSIRTECGSRPFFLAAFLFSLFYLLLIFFSSPYTLNLHREAYRKEKMISFQDVLSRWTDILAPQLHIRRT